jgi:hypothetical protein
MQWRNESNEAAEPALRRLQPRRALRRPIVAWHLALGEEVANGECRHDRTGERPNDVDDGGR